MSRFGELAFHAFVVTLCIVVVMAAAFGAVALLSWRKVQGW